jgi:hypothetical protein
MAASHFQEGLDSDVSVFNTKHQVSMEEVLDMTLIRKALRRSCKAFPIVLDIDSR